MFGYTFPIEPSMTEKEVAAYRSYYCETCHQLRDGYGVMSTIIVSYEMTFASIVLNAVMDDGIRNEAPDAGKLCVFKHSRNRTDLLRKLAAYTVLVANNDLVDDKLDGPSLKSNLGMLWLNRSIEKAKADYPEYDDLIMKGYVLLREKEAERCRDPVEMGRASAASMVWVMREMNKGEWDDDLDRLFESMGVWVYVMDAIEDLDDDFKENQYNPFLIDCGDFTTGREYIERNIYTLSGIMNAIVSDMQTSYRAVREKMRFNTSISDNIIYEGIPVAIRRVFAGESKMQPSFRNIFAGRINRSIGSSF